MSRPGCVFTPAEAARLLGAILIDGPKNGAHQAFQGASTDSRRINPGELFVALQGPNFDGHKFVNVATNRGAAAALVSRVVPDCGIAQIVVSDTTAALGRLAQFWRSRFTLPILALTGSNGKTTVKEMLRAILVAHCGGGEGGDSAVLATRGNLNNHIGLPLMLLSLDAQHRYAVLEMGMNHLGEIDYLVRLAQPKIGLITMAGVAHIGELGSREAIAQAKGEIIGGLDANGIAVINMHDRFGQYWRGLAGSRQVVGFGRASDDEVVGDFHQDRLVVHYQGETADITLRVPGEHNRTNALAATAGALALGVPLTTIRQALAKFQGVAGRTQALNGANGITVIDDTYNANPDSVRAAIEMLAQRPGRRLLVLGDMGELGADAQEMHQEMGRVAREAKLDGLFTLGNMTRETTLAFGTGAHHFDDVSAMLASLSVLTAEPAEDLTILVKGSRFMQMERVVTGLVPHYDGASH